MILFGQWWWWLLSAIICAVDSNSFTWNSSLKWPSPRNKKVCIEKRFRSKLCSVEQAHGANAVDSNTSTFPPVVVVAAAAKGKNLASAPMPLVKNFRKAAGLEFIYRCASTDLLGDLFHNDNEEEMQMSSKSLNEVNFEDNSPEKKILYDVGLVLDLRSQSERDELKAKRWMANAPGGKFASKTFERSSAGRSTGNLQRKNNVEEEEERVVYRIDILSPERLFTYMSKSWLSSIQQRTKYMLNAVFSSEGLHEMRMDILNEKGLLGLYEAIIETSGAELFASLTSIVEYFEATRDGSKKRRGVVVHCVQGKDRTGLVIMLCQSIFEVADDVIIADYQLSEKLLNRRDNDGSSAATTAASKARKDKGGGTSRTVKGKLDRNIFSGSPGEAMVFTLQMIRSKYGSINNYLNSIGFDEKWRDRLRISVSSGRGGVNDGVEFENNTKIQSKL